MALHSSQFSHLNTVDDLIRKLADDEGQQAAPIMAFPTSSAEAINEYEFLRAIDLDWLAEAVVATYIQSQLFPVWRDRNKTSVIAIIGKSTLEYFVSLLGLCTLGYAVLLLSPRLPTEAAVSLLNCTKCSTLVYMRDFEVVANQIQEQPDVRVLRTPERDGFDSDLKTGIDWRREQVNGAGDRTAFIMHSSGSTGLPKPIFQTHKACLENFENGNSSRSFLTAPLYHTFGFASVFRTITKGGLLYMYDHNLPLASNYLLEALENVKPETFFGVPYALKLLAETQDGIDALARCENVIVAGASCPDELGDRLVMNGVHLIVTFGATECGQVAASRPPKGDTSWNYLRFFPNVKPYVYMQPTTDGLHELVILDGLRSKVVSNSDDPPNSFHSRDLFSQHPTTHDAWKYVGRMDDRVTLVNGEKVIPLPIEGRIRDHPLVAEAVVFGVQREFPGLLVFKGPRAQDLDDVDFVDKIWSAVDDANSRSERFSRISKQAIIPIATGVSYPRTDKGTIIRAKVYLEFDKEISALEDLDMNVKCADTDLFNAGMDSLKAAHFPNTIRKRFYIESEQNRKSLGADTIYRCMTVAKIAEYIKDIEDSNNFTDLDLMADLINNYSVSSPSKSEPQSEGDREVSDGNTILLTGCTGSLGSHILKTLLESESTKRVICVVRVPDNVEKGSEVARNRILDSLQKREIDVTPDAFSKVIPLIGDLGHGHFGEILSKNQNVLHSTTSIIHAAWPVDFNLSLESFRPHLFFALQVSRPPARVIFCSSISTTLSTPSPASVPESLSDQLQHAQPTGYARSKLCAEHIFNNAAIQAGADTIVARIGQIVADRKTHIWNSSEAIPLMVRAVDAINLLPDLEDEKCHWLPVDDCARTISELLEDHSSEDTVRGARFFNVLHPSSFSWTNDFLPTLRLAGFKFDIVSIGQWLAHMERSEPNPHANPSIKLLDFWKSRWRAGTYRGQQDIQFDTTTARQSSDTLTQCTSLVESGLLLNLAARWYQEWNT
ncbi:hypothetical protein N7493_007371 [Penicillium malachiteum]|uniref:Carrier domain-containing protein n=1 Tax=Penicillium malachiteum TaxID=1324776 RepID=A0AAD6HJ83_9EURO|nr:hypothetical protein N7493_007371 [Penicillium malachiteum]